MNLHDQDTFLRGKNEGFDAGIQQGISQGISQGAQEAKIQAAKAFLEMGLNIEQIIKGTGLPRETVAELSKLKP